MEHTSAISVRRLIGPLAFLDVICQHVHRMLQSRHIKDWCTQSWSMVVQFGTPQSSILLQEELEKVQKRAARFVTGNFIYETDWHSRTTKVGISEKRRRDSRIIMLYKGLKGAASIPTNDLVPPIRQVRNHHSLAFQTPFANTDINKSSFFPQTIRDWNSLTDSLLSAAECAEDSVAKFTSLVRARD